MAEHLPTVDGKAERAERKLTKLCEMVGCTDDGATWIKQTLDPFNDEPRAKVGFPDVITGKSIIQKIPFAAGYTVGDTPEDVHIFLDSLDTPVFLYDNARYQNGDGILRNNATIDSNFGIGTQRRGGLNLRHGPVGSDLGQETTYNLGGPLGPTGLTPSYLESCGARVLGKGFEVVNATNMLNVGGTVRCYRATGAVPYDNTSLEVCRLPADGNQLNVFEARSLQNVPQNVGEVELYTDHTFWNAKEGCVVVAIPSNQTNEPRQDRNICVNGGLKDTDANRVWLNVTMKGGGSYPETENDQFQMFSPFYLCGAYFTGLPAGSKLDIRGFYYLERFVNSDQKDLVILANPSPCYDAVALEMMSRMAMKLPCGTPIKNNASGDWLKTVADIAGVFGVPGMPLVRSAVDAYQAGRKVWKAWNGPQHMNPQETENGMRALVQQHSNNNKFAKKNQKRQAKGKGAKDRAKFDQKQNNKKQFKTAQRESRAGLASGGSK